MFDLSAHGWQWLFLMNCTAFPTDEGEEKDNYCYCYCYCYKRRRGAHSKPDRYKDCQRSLVNGSDQIRSDESADIPASSLFHGEEKADITEASRQAGRQQTDQIGAADTGM